MEHGADSRGSYTLAQFGRSLNTCASLIRKSPDVWSTASSIDGRSVLSSRAQLQRTPVHLCLNVSNLSGDNVSWYEKLDDAHMLLPIDNIDCKTKNPKRPSTEGKDAFQAKKPSLPRARVVCIAITT